MSKELKKKGKRVQKLYKESNIEQKYYSRHMNCFLRDTVSARKKKIFYILLPEQDKRNRKMFQRKSTWT